MGKALLIVGIILTVLGIGLFTISYINVGILPHATIDRLDGSGNSGETQFSLIKREGVIYPLYSQFKVLFAFDLDSGSSGEMTISIYQAENGIRKGDALSQKTIDINDEDQSTRSISMFFTAAPPIPVVMNPAFGQPSGELELVLVVDAGSGINGYDISYRWFMHAQYLMPVGLILAIVGIILLVVGAVKKSDKPSKRPLPYQSAAMGYEPTLSGTSSSRRREGTSSTSSKRTASKKSKKAKGPACRKCKKPIPKGSQYCPHCYTKQ